MSFGATVNLPGSPDVELEEAARRHRTVPRTIQVALQRQTLTNQIVVRSTAMSR